MYLGMSARLALGPTLLASGLSLQLGPAMATYDKPLERDLWAKCEADMAAFKTEVVKFTTDEHLPSVVKFTTDDQGEIEVTGQAHEGQQDA